MGYMVVTCGYCHQKWHVYGSRDFNSEDARRCPHCQAEIDGQLWEKSVIPAFASLQDANRELFKHSVGYHTPLFQVDYHEDMTWDTTPQNVELIAERIEGLEDTLENMLMGLPQQVREAGVIDAAIHGEDFRQTGERP